MNTYPPPMRKISQKEKKEFCKSLTISFLILAIILVFLIADIIHSRNTSFSKTNHHFVVKKVQQNKKIIKKNSNSVKIHKNTVLSQKTP